jgi:hypothetical protein
MSRLFRLIALAAGVVVFAALIAYVGVRKIAGMLAEVGWGFALVPLLYTAHVTLRAVALWRSLPTPTLSFLDVWRVRLSGEAVEMLTLTGPFLSQPAQGWLLNKRGIGGAEAYGAVAIEYLLYTLTSAWLAIASLTALLVRGVLPVALRAAALGLIAVMVAFTVGVAAAAISGVGLIVPLVRRAGPLTGRRRAEGWAARIDPAERVLVGFMHEHPGRLAAVLGVEAAGQLLLASEIWVVLRALALPARPFDPLLIEGAVKFIGTVFFFVPGQLGASESVYTWLFAALGLTAAAGLTMALVRRIRGLIVGGLGLAAAATMSSRSAEPPRPSA